MWETLKVATFAIPQSHSVDCKAERVRPGRCGNRHPDCSVSELASVEDRHPKRSPYVSSKAGNQSFDCWNVWRSMLRIENPRWYLQTLPVHCEAAHPGTMICSNRLPLMVVDALRTGLHAAAPMRPANSHVKSPWRTVQSTVSVTTLVNGYFKEDLQKLASRLGIEIRVAHYPPYCSKYNPIEHRLFPHLTRACRGVIFHTLETVRFYMAKAETTTGMRVKVSILDKVYATGHKCAAGSRRP